MCNSKQKQINMDYESLIKFHPYLKDKVDKTKPVIINSVSVSEKFLDQTRSKEKSVNKQSLLFVLKNRNTFSYKFEEMSIGHLIVGLQINERDFENLTAIIIITESTIVAGLDSIGQQTTIDICSVNKDVRSSIKKIIQ